MKACFVPIVMVALLAVIAVSAEPNAPAGGAAGETRLPATQSATAPLKIEFDDRGLASITHNGVELVHPQDERFSVHAVNFTDPADKRGARQILEPKPRRVDFDAAAKTLSLEYDWGKVTCAYTVREDRLDLRITLANATSQSIEHGAFFPLRMALPNRYFNRYASYYQEGDQTAAFRIYTHDKGAVGLLNPDHGSLSTASFAYGYGGRFSSFVLALNGPLPPRVAHHPIIDDAYFARPARAVAPGQSETYRLSLVFGPPEAKFEAISAQADAEYAKTHPMTLKWPDRRPIATVFLCNPATGNPKNPRGWFQGNKEIDVTTPEGLDKFGAKLMEYADNCILRMKRLNAQGVIVWDIEGQEMPHMISYLGDPRVLPDAAPEMNKFADAFMKKFSDAGFKTGVTIRPTEVYRVGTAEKPAWGHREVKDPVATMSQKIAYAQKRWGSTIYYMDSSVFGPDYLTPEQRKEMRGIDWIMPTMMVEKLTKLHPDCLISPEFSQRDHYRFGAPYSSPNLGDGGTDPAIRHIWPDAFRLVGVRDQLLERRWEHFADSVAKGDVLLFCPWFDSPEMPFVQLLYQEAAIRKGGDVAVLAKADLATLEKKARDSAEATRYAAAVALGSLGTKDVVAPLATLLTDDNALVRKQALVALAQIKQIDDANCIALLAAWIKGSRDPVQNAMRSLAAEALARGGDAAVPDLVAILADDKAAATWPYAVRVLGRCGTTDANAIQALIGLLGDKTPGRAQLRNDVIESLGLLKAKDAVPAILSILDKRDRESEDERGVAVRALGRISDRRAVEPLIRYYKVGHSTVVVYWIRGAVDEALRAITGEQNVVGADEWEQWLKKQ